MEQKTGLLTRFEREIYLLLVSAFWIGVYFGVDSLPNFRTPATLDWDPVWNLPLVKAFCLPYVSLYIMPVFLLFVPHEPRFFRRFAVAFLLAILVSSVFFVLLPLELPRPQLTGDGLLERILRQIYEHDASGNFFPSQHVTVSYLLALGTGRLKKAWRLPMLAWASLIAVSTFMVHQHYVVDAIAGLVLAIVVWKGLLLYEKKFVEKTDL